MKKIGSRGQRWLRGLHIYAACVWVGCATVLVIAQHFVVPQNDGELHGILVTLDFIDLFILVPGAIGVLVTSLVYSIWTQWGWFRHRWIAVKWFICITGILFGTFWLGPWLSDNAHMAQRMGMGAFEDATFTNNRINFMIFGALQAGTLLITVFISTLRPWKRKKL
jgi:hypothetical protein